MTKDIWDKIEILSKFLGATLIPIAIALLGHFYSTASTEKELNQKQGELDLKYIELAIELLKAEPSPDTESLREWAISIVNNYSTVEISADTKEELKSSPILSREHLCATEPCKVLVDFLARAKVAYLKPNLDYLNKTILVNINSEVTEVNISDFIKSFNLLNDSLPEFKNISSYEREVEMELTFEYKGVSYKKSKSFIRIVNDGDGWKIVSLIIG